MFQGTPTSHSVQHPSTVSALRADPPSPTRGEGKIGRLPLTPWLPPRSWRCRSWTSASSPA
ncbi:MAG: hypothetical protein EOS07_09280 [Mesorhizobium sp.]|nr:MAG: hypothetical protein EOQ56_17940 [Mesorhizobium sp.]RWO10222.1 MAG: hypothetical protein EOS07_09280 [Mesorhizobium sp.]RWP98475.1 MAG: hypothetical protein EOR89_19440 [Mesorhizobium sp.]RWQ19109.1 MAG: hypothetical protein EOR92_14375 [Mesorhizobium sp.]RWQ49879.1 MAG: hypothetical protein EOS82_15875 [Mesorhizobium sp.]